MHGVFVFGRSFNEMTSHNYEELLYSLTDEAVNELLLLADTVTKHRAEVTGIVYTFHKPR